MSVRRLQLVLDLDTGRYSGRLRQAGSDLQRFNGTVNQGSRGVNDLGRSFDSLNNRMSTPLQKLRDYVLILGNLRFAIMNVRDIAVGWVVGLIKQSAEVERLTMLMTGLSTATTEFGKNAEAQKSLKALYDMSRNSGFAVKELSDAFVKFKAGGLDPTNGSLQSLVDATARFGGTSETMHRASIAIQQMSGKGVISMEELRQQLGEAVPTAIRDMARAMGVGVGALVKEISDGKVKSGPALKALFDEWERMYSGSAKRMSQTLNGQLAQLRTNIMESSTLFTNLSGNITPAIRADLEEQQRLYEAGKITAQQFEQASAHIRASAEKEGVYSNSISGLKSLNEALQTDEAKAAIVSFGQAVNTAMSGLIAGVQHIVRWRNEYGTAIQIILSGMAMIMARNLGAWMLAQFGSMGGMWATLRGQVTGMSVAWGQMTGSLNNLSSARVREAVDSQRALTLARAEQATAMQTVAVSRAKLATLTAERVAINQQIAAMTARQAGQQRLLNIARAEMIQGNQSIAQKQRVARLDQQLTVSTQTLANAKQRLIMVDGQLIAAERALTVAQTTETAAANGATAAQTRHAAATGFMATAARIGAGALGFLRAGFSMLLGPVGMVIMVIATLCSQLGVFTSKAQAARAAADDLRQGLVSLARTKAVDGQISANNAANASDQALLERGHAGGVHARKQFSAEERARIQARIDARNQQTAGFVDARGSGQRHQVRNRASEWTQAWQDEIEALDGRTAHTYSNAVTAAERRFGEGTAAYKRAVDAARKTQDAQRASGRRNVERKAQGWLNQPGKAQNTIEMEARRRAFADLQRNMSGAGDAAAVATPEIAAAGKAAGGAGGKADKAANQLGNMAEKVAVLQARAAGSGETLAKFEQQIKNGEMKDWSKVQLDRGRALAMATDALKDNATAAGGAKQANESFDNMLANTSGAIAELSAELLGGEGDLERFNGELAAGKYDGVTEDRIDQMRRYLIAKEQLTKDKDWQKNITKLDKDINKSAVESDGLWASWSRGTLEADKRLNQVREKYGDIIEQAELAAAAGDPTKLDQVNAKIEKIATNMARADTTEVINQWKTAAEEITIGLMTEDGARQANFDREIQRQTQLVNWTSMTATQRLEAERRLNDYKIASQARLNRENEHAIIKQARGWATLGQGIQQALAGGLSEFVDGLGEAEFSFKDFAKKMLVQLLKIIVQAMIAYAILSAIGMANNADGQKVSFGSFMKGQVGAGFGMGGGKGSEIGFKAAPPPVPVGHTGGVIGSLSQWGNIGADFSSAKKYHTGGYIGQRSLRPGEVPMIGMEGELVLTEQHQALLGARLAGSGAAPNVQVNIINNSGESVNAEVGEPEWNGKEMVLGIVLEAMNKEGPLRDSMRNAR